MGDFVVADGDSVSILAQPEGRALRSLAMPHGLRPRRFNPRPARRPGATRFPSPSLMGPAVSILAQPEGRALREKERQTLLARKFQSSPSPKAGRYGARRASKIRGRPVSILAQPEGRALQGGCRRDAAADRFQSSPSPKAGRCAAGVFAASCAGSFNPRPARRPGVHCIHHRTPLMRVVSILAQPEGRALR